MRDFQEARALVRALKLKSQKEWAEWSRSGKRPKDIPSTPFTVYRNAGWKSMPDWLGYKPNYGGPKTGVAFLPVPQEYGR